MRILKKELLWLHELPRLEEGSTSPRAVIDQDSHQHEVHSATGSTNPIDFEQAFQGRSRRAQAA